MSTDKGNPGVYEPPWRRGAGRPAVMMERSIGRGRGKGGIENDGGFGFRGGGGRGRGRGRGITGRGIGRGLNGSEAQGHFQTHKHIEQGSSGNEGNGHRRQKHLGFKFVENLLKVDTSYFQVVNEVSSNLDAWGEFLRSETLLSPPRGREDNHTLLRMSLHLLAKICVNDELLPSLKNDVALKSIMVKPWVDKINEKIRDLIMAALGKERGKVIQGSAGNGTVRVDTSPTGFLTDIYDFCSFVAKVMPQSARDFLRETVSTALGTVAALKGMALGSGKEDKLDELSELEKKFHDLLQCMQKEENKEILKEKKIQFADKNRRGGFSRADMDIFDDLEPSTNFREITVVPLIQELTKGRRDIDLRPNKDQGAYNDADHYLDIQFRLLREDFVAPLREGIQELLRSGNPLEYLRKKTINSDSTIRTYHPIRFVRSEVIKGTIHFWLKLPEQATRRVTWEKSKKLLNGNLVLLTNDFFKTATFATVGNRPRVSPNPQKPQEDDGMFSIIPEGNDAFTFFDENHTSCDFLLVESEVYFVAYRHVLKTLQSLPLQQFPLGKYILGAQSKVEPPPYLIPWEEESDTEEEEPTWPLPVKTVNTEKLTLTLPESNLSVEVRALDDSSWPSSAALGLDENQYVSFKAALTSQFSIIQGPPGTGKTYLGLRIAEVLLQNKDLWMINTHQEYLLPHQKRNNPFDDDSDSYDIDESKTMVARIKTGPLIVVCYTNHALDQFLEGILEIYKKSGKKEHDFDGFYPIVRMGGRCGSEDLKEFEIAAVRRHPRWKQNQGHASAYYRRNVAQLFQEIGLLGSQVQSLGEIQNELLNLQGLVDFTSLEIWSESSELSSQFPPQIWRLLGQPSFLGLSRGLFMQGRFDAERIVNSWFGEIPKNPNSKVAHLQLKKSQEPEAVEVEKDDEDYDKDDLMRNRLEEDYGYGVKKETVNFSSRSGHIVYIEDLNVDISMNRIRDIKWERQRRIMMMENKLKGVDIPEETAQQRRELDFEIMLCQRRIDLLNAIIRRIKGGRFSGEMERESILERMEEIMYYPNPQSLFPDMTSRWTLYLLVAETVANFVGARKRELERNLIEQEDRLSQIQRLADVELLKQCEVVGMTTTGANKFYDILKNLGSKIAIVEEAAEVLEAHVVTCLTKHCEQLILIGDHFQLKPSTTVFDLQQKYNLDVSLFERMINNKLHFYSLKVQHRMRPEISDLVRGTIYKELDDHPSVMSRKPVLGVKSNLFFVTHEVPEAAEAESKSRSNDFEVDYLFGLCQYLLLQGYTKGQITVLTTYTGQMFKLKKRFRDGGDGAGSVRITCVDNFQGEENDIILLSLVRSNEDGKIGFLKEPNRVCVALSRAREGFFIVGNMKALTSWKPKKLKDTQYRGIWSKILDKFQSPTHKSIGAGLPIFCRNHPAVIAEVEEGKEFKEKAPEGGCTKLCNFLLNCGHRCPRMCHVDGFDHSKLMCMERCSKTCQEEEKHQCRQRCHEPCDPCRHSVTIIHPSCRHDLSVHCCIRRKEFLCKTRVDKDLDCGHTARKVHCHVDKREIECAEPMMKTPACGLHPTEMACFKDPIKFLCPVEVEKQLPCNHLKKMKCHIDVNEVRCRQIVDKLLTKCSHIQRVDCWVAEEDVKCEAIIEKVIVGCGHRENVKCHLKNDTKTRCTQDCTTRLDCGHNCRKKCHPDLDPNHEEYECKKKCSKSCERGHPCKAEHQCFLHCPPCPTFVEKNLPCGVGHKGTMKCGLNPSKFGNCREKCDRIHPCGHKCDKLCKDKCGLCKVVTTKRIPECGHYISDIECGTVVERSMCKTLVNSPVKSKCGHEVIIPCDKTSGLTPEKVQRYCAVNCTYKFPLEEGGCGHSCPGTCGSCLGGRFHRKCAQPCERTLICGHRCDFPCTADCPPCRQECFMKCVHSECKKSCGKQCSICKEKCTWNCPHYQCSKKCGETCSRPPCSESCPQQLKCGHNCIGFCGEPCPKLCRICDKDELTTSPITLVEYEDDARFVFLPDCGHTIEVDALRSHLLVKILAPTNPNDDEDEIDPDTDSEGLEEFRPKMCPLCPTIIRSCRRFQDLITQHFDDVRKARNKINQNYKDRQKETRQKQLLELIRKWAIYPDLKNLGRFFIQKLMEEKVVRSGYGKNSVTRKQAVLKPVEPSEFASLKFLCEIMQGVVTCLGKNMLPIKNDSMTVGKLLFLFDEIVTENCRTFPLSVSETNDLQQEYARLIDFAELEKFAKHKSHPKVTQTYEDAFALLDALRPYTKMQQNLCRLYLTEMESTAKTGLGLTQAEKIEIVKAMGMGSGHWFKCPNGHIYAIGDCGGAMVVSKCNECNAQIGGTNHALLHGNKLASEMDGARTPAWPQPQLGL